MSELEKIRREFQHEIDYLDRKVEVAFENVASTIKAISMFFMGLILTLFYMVLQ